MRRTSVVSLVLMVAGWVVACNGDENEADVSGDLVADPQLDVIGDIEGEEEPAVEELADEEIGPGGVVVEVRKWLPIEDEAVLAEGVQVAFIGGEDLHLERTTGTDGRATFENLDWDLIGTVAVSAFLEGYEVETFVGLNEDSFVERVGDQGQYPITLYNPFETGFVEISGTATNMQSESDYLVVSTDISGSAWEQQGPDWSVQVPPGRPFTLVAVEYWPSGSGNRFTHFDNRRSAVVEHGAVTGPTTIDFEMEETFGGTSFEGSFQVPGHATTSFFTTAWPHVAVFAGESWDDTLFLGSATDRDYSDGGMTVEYSGVYLPLSDVGDAYTHFVWLSGLDRSGISVPGFPMNGAQDIVFPEPVQITAPIGRNRVSIGEEIAWTMNAVDAADPELGLILSVTAVDWRLVQRVYMPPGTTSLVLPELPSDITPEELYGTGLRGQIVLCGDIVPGTPWCRRAAVSTGFTIEP